MTHTRKDRFRSILWVTLLRKIVLIRHIPTGVINKIAGKNRQLTTYHPDRVMQYSDQDMR